MVAASYYGTTNNLDRKRTAFGSTGSQACAAWTWLPVASSRDGEGEEAGVEQLGVGSILVVTDEEVAHDLARPRDLT